MANRVCTAASTATTTSAAVESAVAAALEGLAGARPQLGFLFTGPHHDSGIATRLASRLSGAHVLGASTAGEFTERGLTQDGLALLLLATDDPVLTHFVKAEERETDVARLCDGWLEMSRQATHNKRANSISILMVDGLSGIGPTLVNQLRQRTRPYQTIVGGAAGDNGQFHRTQVALDGRTTDKGAAVAHIFSQAPWSVGVGHGLVPDSARMLVTQAEEATVYQIDDKPAFEAYRGHAAARGVSLEPGAALPYLTAHQLGIFFLDRLECARAALQVLPDGAIRYAGPIPHGSRICILGGDDKSMNNATEQAAQAAVSEGEIAGLLVFSCICRKAMLGAGFIREIDAVRKIAGAQTPIAGFLTYGEIARSKGKLEGWHNATTVVVGIPA